MNRLSIALGVVALALGALACGSGSIAPRHLDLYPTPNALPTQTERVLVVTQRPEPTLPPILVVVSATPNTDTLCVSATEAVYLRPSPAADNYPIATLLNGEIVRDLGGRSGVWVFVEWQDKNGWINSLYLLQTCP